MMDWQKICVKYYLTNPDAVAMKAFIPEFHRWIQNNRLPVQLIDVHDYSHVFQGPGILLVADEANFSIDETDGRLGFACNYKRPLSGSTSDRLRRVFGLAVRACRALERSRHLDPAPSFDSGRFRVSLNDRLATPNDEPTRAAFQPELEGFLTEFYPGSSLDISAEAEPRRRFSLEVAASDAPDLNTLFKALK